MSCATRSSKQRIRHIVASSSRAALGRRRAGHAAASLTAAQAVTGAVPSTWRTAPEILRSSGSTNASIGSL